jgi:hypothetical protein
VVVRELVLLESDANLSSLMREAELQVRKPASPAIAGDPSGANAAPAVEGEAADEDASLAQRISAGYERFDGAAYREEMRRIAEGA